VIRDWPAPALAENAPRKGAEKRTFRDFAGRQISAVRRRELQFVAWVGATDAPWQLAFGHLGRYDRRAQRPDSDGLGRPAESGVAPPRRLTTVGATPRTRHRTVRSLGPPGLGNELAWTSTRSWPSSDLARCAAIRGQYAPIPGITLRGGIYPPVRGMAIPSRSIATPVRHARTYSSSNPSPQSLKLRVAEFPRIRALAKMASCHNRPNSWEFGYFRSESATSKTAVRGGRRAGLP